MHTLVEKSQHEVSQFSLGSDIPRAGGAAIAQLQDNRPQASAHSALKALVENSPRIRQMEQFQASDIFRRGSDLRHESLRVSDQEQTRKKPLFQMKTGRVPNDDSRDVEVNENAAQTLQPKSLVPSSLTLPSNAAGSNQTRPVQRVLTKMMHNTVIDVIEEGLDAKYGAAFIEKTTYGPAAKAEMILLLQSKLKSTDSEMSIEDEVDDGDEEGIYAEDDAAEVGLNDEGHNYNVLSDDGIENSQSYKEAAGEVQLKRTGKTMSGPKSYGSYKNVFYVLNKDGAINFSAKPTADDHKAFSPLKGRKKVPLKGAIVWDDPVIKKSFVNLKNHPKAKFIDKKNRDQHFGMADKLLAGSKPANTIAKERQSNKWTWHHLPDQYEMVLVQTEVHAKHGHNGGVFLW